MVFSDLSLYSSVAIIFSSDVSIHFIDHHFSKFKCSEAMVGKGDSLYLRPKV